MRLLIVFLVLFVTTWGSALQASPSQTPNLMSTYGIHVDQKSGIPDCRPFRKYRFESIQSRHMMARILYYLSTSSWVEETYARAYFYLSACTQRDAFLQATRDRSSVATKKLQPREKTRPTHNMIPVAVNKCNKKQTK